MVSAVKIILSKTGIDEFLHEQGIVDELLNQADRINAEAGGDYEIQVWDRPTKTVVNVLDPGVDAMGLEAQSGNLARAVSNLKIKR